ncbi:MAG TPA: hypothetical protein VFS08_04525 [Gemmatimonadaceae bacterium]|nr:hypothetical protein [Gemmatimonadaceae bacterium]
MPRKIGLLVGREWSFPPAFIDEVARQDADVTAEYVQLDAARMDEPCPYDLVIDRISHEVPYYRTWLKKASLDGCVVVNNPFMWTADDKFFGAALATQLGVASPRTVALPNKEYVPGIKHDESLRNLRFPLDWAGLVEYVGLPCVLKDAHGGGWTNVYVCHSLEELLHHYDHSGRLTMVVQEFIEWEHFVRCICIGQEHVLPMKYDPRERKYHVEHEHLTPALGARIVNDSLTLCRALGYDMNSLEFAVKDGVPYAIDFMNPAPDMDVYSLTPHYFEWAVRTMAAMAICLATAERRPPEMRRGGFLVGRRFAGIDERVAGGGDGREPAGAAEAAGVTDVAGAAGAAGANATSRRSGARSASGAAGRAGTAAARAATTGAAKRGATKAAATGAAKGAARKTAAPKTAAPKTAARKTAKGSATEAPPAPAPDAVRRTPEGAGRDGARSGTTRGATRRSRGGDGSARSGES